jgi:hypothetical protein
MWIKSQFKDYYDSQQRFTQGNQVWTRNHIFRQTPTQCLREYGHRNRFVIGFCGTLYYGVKDTRTSWDTKETTTRYCYDVSDYCRSNDPVHGKYRKSFESDNQKFFGKVEDHSLFRKWNSPILIGRYDWKHVYGGSPESVINWTCHTLGEHKSIKHYGTKDERPELARLESFDFQKIRAPELAYQEIVGYITGTLMVEHTSVPEQTNQDKIQQHGFDNASFRTSK